jgi:hypothetical protein
MKPSYHIKLLLFTLAIGLVLWLVHWINGWEVAKFSWASLVFFAVLNAGLALLGRESASNSNASFLYKTVGGMFIRLILGIVFLVIYLISSDVVDKKAIVVFMGLYLLFTTFDKYFLVAKLRAEKQGSNPSLND